MEASVHTDSHGILSSNALYFANWKRTEFGSK